MKQVLTASDDGILVYVAPTKALVTQVCNGLCRLYHKLTGIQDYGRSLC